MRPQNKVRHGNMLPYKSASTQINVGKGKKKCTSQCVFFVLKKRDPAGLATKSVPALKLKSKVRSIS